ncbi:hypothetical protein [uncultured Litoreibacter sp.]|uniref:hypothetical protein n=1 Tax=uncultured Litoreibacter sp. TaxID=1392394 RepID=UPI002614BD6A|nr:hypothetical protein [uncultured Litoreibacter sp.]
MVKQITVLLSTLLTVCASAAHSEAISFEDAIEDCVLSARMTLERDNQPRRVKTDLGLVTIFGNSKHSCSVNGLFATGDQGGVSVRQLDVFDRVKTKLAEIGERYSKHRLVTPQDGVAALLVCDDGIWRGLALSSSLGTLGVTDFNGILFDPEDVSEAAHVAIFRTSKSAGSCTDNS